MSDATLKAMQAEMTALMTEDCVLLSKRLEIIKSQLEIATFLNDAAQVQQLREQYHAVVDRRLDIYQSHMKLTQKLLDHASRS